MKLITPSPVPLGSLRYLKKNSSGYVPMSGIPRKFRLIEPKYEKAIVIPYLSTAARWHELKYCLRSIERFWKDEQCPIVIICDQKPGWLKKHPRIEVVEVTQYKSNNRAGYWEACQIGWQIAETCAWWNDDIYLLQPVGWEDLEIALTEGDVTDSVDGMLASSNEWMRAMGRSVADLLANGCERVWRFATHTPFLFEREKSLEILRTYSLAHKGSWANLYFNHHNIPHRDLTPYKTRILPCEGNPWYLNHQDPGPDEKTAHELFRMFPDPAPWESAHAS